MGCRARFSWWSPPRFSRWRTTRPEEASIGAAPASMAKAASERSRPGCDQLTSTWAAVTGPTRAGQQRRRHHPDQDGQLLAEPGRLLVGGQGPLGGGPQRPHGRSILHRVVGLGGQRRPGPRLAQPPLAAQAGPQRLGRGHQQGLEVPAGIGGLDGTGPGELEHPQGLALAARPRVARCSRLSASRPARIASSGSLLAWVRPVRLGRALRGKGTSSTAGDEWATRATGVSLPCQAATKTTGSIVEDGRLRSEPLSLPAPTRSGAQAGTPDSITATRLLCAVKSVGRNGQFLWVAVRLIARRLPCWVVCRWGRHRRVPLGLLFDPAGNGGDIDWAAGVDLQHRTAQAKRAHPGVQRGFELGIPGRDRRGLDAWWVRAW
jgi:hypothetical protein